MQFFCCVPGHPKQQIFHLARATVGHRLTPQILHTAPNNNRDGISRSRCMVPYYHGHHRNALLCYFSTEYRKLYGLMVCKYVSMYVCINVRIVIAAYRKTTNKLSKRNSLSLSSSILSFSFFYRCWRVGDRKRQ